MSVRGIDLRGGWSEPEVSMLTRFLSPLPRGWLEENPNIKAIIRRSVLTDAPPEAPGHSKYDAGQATIVVYDKGVYHRDRIDPEQFRRSVFHELAHSILESDPSILDRWNSRTSGDGFVDEYAKTNPAEDFCDSFSEFLIFPQKTQRVVPRKWRFLYNLMQSARSQEKVAMHFINAFTDELTKTADKTEALKDLAMQIKKLITSHPVAATALGGAGIGAASAGEGNRMKGALVGGALGAGAGAVGRRIGANPDAAPQFINRAKNTSKASRVKQMAAHARGVEKAMGSNKALAGMGIGAAAGGMVGGRAMSGSEKNAASSGALHGLMEMVGKAMSSKAAKGAAIAGAGGLGGTALGLAKGKRTGYDQGTGDVGVVAQKALQIGRQLGVQIGYQYALQQMKNQGK